MSYFNHAFCKVFLGTGLAAGTNLPTGVLTAEIDPSGGYIDVDGIHTSALSDINATASANHAIGPVASGYFGIFNAKTNLSIGNTEVTGCCNFYIASSPLMASDKIGPYAGGYRESNKSKMINPKYLHQWYRVDPCTPQQSIISIGNTVGTVDCDGFTTAQDNGFQGGTTCEDCCFDFYCGETYYLRIDVKGSPALRLLNHNAYKTFDAYTGCCPTASPTLVNSTLVMLAWARQILSDTTTNPVTGDPYMKDLIFPVVFDEAGIPWYPDGTTVTVDGTNTPVSPAEWFSAYDETTAHTPDACAGLRLYGAYVETKFGNCTFQVTDFFEKEPVAIFASLVDYTGDPCTFEGLCVYTECYGVQGMGFGEQVLRDVILSESYLQNYVGSGNDFRVREITQGYDIIDSVDRNALYGRYFILHTVPRFNNPSGTFDNDQYMCEIIYTEATPATPIGLALFEAAFINVINDCPGCITDVELKECSACDVIPDTPTT